MSGPTPKRRRPANPRPRVPRTHTQPFPFLAELADIYGLDEAGEVAREHVRREEIERLDWLVVTLATNPQWGPRVKDDTVPGGERGLIYNSGDADEAHRDDDQLTTAERAISRAALGAIADARAHQSLKDFVDAEVARYGSTRAFAAHLVDLDLGPRKPRETPAAARARQIKAQIRKLQEWTQTTKKNGQPANPKHPGQPKYTEPGASKSANNAKRIAAARGSARRWAVRVLRGMPVTIGLAGWWRAYSGGGHKQAPGREGLDDWQFPADAETRPPEAPAVRTILQADGADLIGPLEATKHDAELLVLYQLKVTLHNFRRTVAAGPQDGA